MDPIGRVSPPAMKIVNKTKNIILADETIIADSPFKRMQGLLGKKGLKAGEALIIKPCNSIHTFFMRFAIDVLFVNKDNRIVKAISGLRPFRLTGIYYHSVFAVELTAGIIRSTATCPGDLLSIE